VILHHDTRLLVEKEAFSAAVKMLYRAYLQTVQEPWIKCVGNKFVDACVEEAEGGECKPFPPAVYLQSHEDSIFARANMHVAHVKCAKEVEDAAYSQHPCDEEPYGPPLVVKQLPENPHCMLPLLACVYAPWKSLQVYIAKLYQDDNSASAQHLSVLLHAITAKHETGTYLLNLGSLGFQPWKIEHCHPAA
jgi:hypothetical protein